MSIFINKERLSLTKGPYMNYTVSKANLDLGKNMLLLENPQFLPNLNKTLPK